MVFIQSTTPNKGSTNKQVVTDSENVSTNEVKTSSTKQVEEKKQSKTGVTNKGKSMS